MFAGLRWRDHRGIARDLHNAGPIGRVGRLRGGGPFRRSNADRMVGGVCAALARRIRIDPALVRVGFLILALFGVGVAAYVLSWLLVPLEGETSSIASRAATDRSGIALAVALVTVFVLAWFLASALGASFVGSSYLWWLVIAIAGLVLIWRNASPAEQSQLRRLARPLTELLTNGGRSRRALSVRLVAAAGLLIGGLTQVLGHHGTGQVVRPIVGVLLVMAAVVAVFGPWWLRVARDLVAERQARTRAEERAEVASRVHDSVLQTLALIQRRADNPSEVAKLARAQERELRAWLFEGRPAGSSDEQDHTLVEAVRRLQKEVEELHGATVETVVVGDCPLDERVSGLVAACREATVNAAKWSGAPVISVFAEVTAGEVSVFVRDTGVGFDPTTVPADRKGLAESVQGRMTRLRGSAKVRSAPGEGTEVALVLPLDQHSRAPS
ncbi:MAG: PspC domain-containing protein [Acidimicrobiales bacterium]|nr:PspC domain-containing protein [Acidimicrobiales bacterium]